MEGLDSGGVYEQAVVKTVAGFFRGNPKHLFGVTRGSGGFRGHHTKLDGFSLTREGDGGSLEAWLDWRELWLRVWPTM